jgi:hypothetical protein
MVRKRRIVRTKKRMIRDRTNQFIDTAIGLGVASFALAGSASLVNAAKNAYK